MTQVELIEKLDGMNDAQIKEYASAQYMQHVHGAGSDLYTFEVDDSDPADLHIKVFGCGRENNFRYIRRIL